MDAITFFFVDIEGSDRRHQQPMATEAALARCESLVHGRVAAHGGHVFEIVGGARHTAFAMAADACAAALAIHRALKAEDESEPAAPQVRMALHTGAAEERDGRYAGPSLAQAAGLLGAASGGQILVSGATVELVRAALPPGAEVRDLGEARLTECARPERIFQLVATDVPAAIAPPRTLVPRPTDLPAPLTPLVGREREAAAVSALLRRDGVRLVTLTGPGGIGKTRLGLQAAAELRDDFAHGVVFVALAPIDDPDLVVPTIASALAVADGGGRRLIDRLADELRDKQLLLVLDNFEQVLPAAASVAHLLAIAAGLKVLVTSRAVLQLYGEHHFPVPPLALPDPERGAAGTAAPVAALERYEAVRLFVVRAQAVKPDFQLTAANAAAVVECCRRVDGLPLAIELAAARIRLLPPQALLERLERRLTLLTGGGRNLPTRQQTLRAAIAWSYDLLDLEDRGLFELLGVFAGGFTLTAAATLGGAAAGPTLDVLAGVESLVNNSLLRQEEDAEGEPRFDMLETIREYALERLEASGPAPAARAAHARHYLALAEQAELQLTGPQQEVWLRRLAVEHDNFRAALRWSLGLEEAAGEDGRLATRLAGALWRFWEIRGHLSEGRAWLARALGPSAASGGGDPDMVALRAKALNGAGNLAWTQGDYAAARRFHEESLALRRSLGDRAGIAASLNNLGVVVAAQGEAEAARALHGESLELRRALGDEQGIAASLNSLGGLALDRGEHAAARGHYEESLGLLRRVGDRRGVATALSNLGVVAEDEADYAAARQLYEESLALRRDLGDRRGIATALNNLGVVALAQGDHAAARRHIEESLALRRELGDRWGIATALSNLGGLAWARGDYAAARALHTEGLDLKRELGDQRGVATALDRLGEAAAAQGDHTAARRHYEESLGVWRALGDGPAIAAALDSLGGLALDKGDAAAARALHDESLAVRREVGDTWDIAASLETLAGLAALQGQPAHALRLAGAAAALREAIDAPLPPSGQARLERWLAPARSTLAAAAAAAAWAEGRAMLLEHRPPQSGPAPLPPALRIEIDRIKQAQQVAEITGTDYFEMLKKKVSKRQR